jgi:hypothetical protein
VFLGAMVSFCMATLGTFFYLKENMRVECDATVAFPLQVRHTNNLSTGNLSAKGLKKCF